MGWLLTSRALPWLVTQCRLLQVMLAAHHPQLFRHLIAEGLAPELFYCWWLQGLFYGCLQEDELVKLWDLFVFERSHKILVRTAVAIFCLLDKRLLGKPVEDMVKVLF